MQKHKNTVEKALANKFQQYYCVHRLYRNCYQIYKDKWSKLPQKYANFFSFIKLFSQRTIKLQKQNHLIAYWSQFFRQKTNKKYVLSQSQQLLKLIDILQQRKTQIGIFINFVKQLGLAEWEKLKVYLIDKLTLFIKKIQNTLVDKFSHLKTNNQKYQKFIQQFRKQQKYSKQQQQSAFRIKKQNQFSFDINKTSKPQDEIVLGLQNVGYITKSKVLCKKEKPQPIKLLTQDQLQNIKKFFLDKYKPTTLASRSLHLKKLQNHQFKTIEQNYFGSRVKIPKFLAVHTQISEDQNQMWNNEGKKKYKNNLKTEQNLPLKNQQKRKKNPKKHNNSILGSPTHDRNKIDESKNSKFKTFHDIEHLNSYIKHSQTNKQLKSSKYTKGTSNSKDISPQMTLGVDFGKKSNYRFSKISLSSKIEKGTMKNKTISFFKKKQREGVILKEQQIKNLQLPFPEIAHEQEQQLQEDLLDSFSDSSSSSKLNFQEVKNDSYQNKNSQIAINIQQFDSIHTTGGLKKKRRNAMSRKHVNPFKLIQSETSQKKFSDSSIKKSKSGTRTSFYRSSGFNLLEEKKNGNMSKFDQIKYSKNNKISREPQAQFLQQNQQNQIEKKKVNRSKLIEKTSHRIKTEEYQIRRNQAGSITLKQAFGIINEIHLQDKLNKNQYHEQYNNEMMRRKYQTRGNRCLNQNGQSGQKTLQFKMQKTVQEKHNIKHKCDKSNQLIDFIKQSVRQYQLVVLGQNGFD